MGFATVGPALRCGEATRYVDDYTFQKVAVTADAFAGASGPAAVVRAHSAGSRNCVAKLAAARRAAADLTALSGNHLEARDSEELVSMKTHGARYSDSDVLPSHAQPLPPHGPPRRACQTKSARSHVDHP